MCRGRYNMKIVAFFSIESIWSVQNVIIWDQRWEELFSVMALGRKELLKHSQLVHCVVVSVVLVVRHPLSPPGSGWHAASPADHRGGDCAATKISSISLHKLKDLSIPREVSAAPLSLIEHLFGLFHVRQHVIVPSRLSTSPLHSPSCPPLIQPTAAESFVKSLTLSSTTCHWTTRVDSGVGNVKHVPYQILT